MTLVIAILLFTIFLFLSAFHFYWAVGGRWGSQAVFPTKDDTTSPKMPGIIPTLVVAVGLLIVGLFMLTKADLLTVALPGWLNTYGGWIVAFLFIARAIGEFKYVGFFKKIRNTTFGQYDTKYYSPLCVFIGILILMLELWR